VCACLSVCMCVSVDLFCPPLTTTTTFLTTPHRLCPHPRISRNLCLLEMCVEMSTRRRVWVSRGQKTLQKYPPPPMPKPPLPSP
jgi:hypothetical protein